MSGRYTSLMGGFGVILLFCSALVFAAEPNGKINQQNSNNNNNVNKVYVTTLLNNRVITQLFTGMGAALQQTLAELKNKTGEYASSFISSTGTFVWENKWKVLFATLVGSYVGLNVVIVTLDRQLHDPMHWFNWKKHLDLADLFAVSKDTLSEELLKEIQQRYTVMTNPADFISPLITFMNKIEQECLLLQRYLAIGAVLGKTGCKQYTLYDEKFEQQCVDYLRRSNYLKSLFMQWMADFKLKQNQAAAVPAGAYLFRTIGKRVENNVGTFDQVLDFLSRNSLNIFATNLACTFLL